MSPTTNVHASTKISLSDRDIRSISSIDRLCFRSFITHSQTKIASLSASAYRGSTADKTALWYNAKTVHRMRATLLLALMAFTAWSARRFGVTWNSRVQEQFPTGKSTVSPPLRVLYYMLIFYRNDCRVQLYVWRLEACRRLVAGTLLQDLRRRRLVLDCSWEARPSILVHLSEAGPGVHRSEHSTIHQSRRGYASTEALVSTDHGHGLLPRHLATEDIVYAGTPRRSLLLQVDVGPACLSWR